MRKKIWSLPVLLLMMCSSNAQLIKQPHLAKRDNATQLIVNGKPYLVLGGELHNSSSSSLAYMQAQWKPLQQQHLNTVLAAVAWQQVEPQENKFDFTLVDGLINSARSQGLKVILLWFASWKNGLSHYVPTWVKKDYKRFPRIVLQNGKSTETISALSNEAAAADAKAFAALMRHVKETDAQQQTVIMVQIENEVGIIGDTRDHSLMGNAEFAKPVPAALLNGMEKYKDELQPSYKKSWEAAGAKKSGSWAEVFGNNASADEAFMVWHYARYINQVAEAGKAAYNIPMFVNAWIVQPQDTEPGDYPSGGPQAHVHDIWRIAAPALDLWAPDIYLPDFKRIVNEYHHAWNPLFIPESFSGLNGAANAFYAIGNHNAIGYSPFGIDNKAGNPAETPLAKAYNILAQLTPQILEAQATNAIKGISLDKMDSIQNFELGGYQVMATLRKNWNGVSQTDKGYGLVIHSGKDEFIVAGSDIDITFVPASPGPQMAGLASVYEGEYAKGTWKPGRLLNGDEVMMSYKLAQEAAANKTGTGARLNAEPAILKVQLYRYQ